MGDLEGGASAEIEPGIQTIIERRRMIDIIHSAVVSFICFPARLKGALSDIITISRVPFTEEALLYL
jgi:hypothetical protein